MCVASASPPLPDEAPDAAPMVALPVLPDAGAPDAAGAALRAAAAGASCGPQAACVAGRCVGRESVVSIATARRVLFEPVDVGYVRNGESAVPEPALAWLGPGTAATVFFRFAIDLPPETTVLEAYLDLPRAADLDRDRASLVLHAARVVEAWDGRDLSWARQPRLEEVSAPRTHVLPWTAAPVRLDVRDLVRVWRRHAPDDFGVAVVADGAGRLAFALRPTGTVTDNPARSAEEGDGNGLVPAAAPVLELYVK
jgi:hypothetical protein